MKSYECSRINNKHFLNNPKHFWGADKRFLTVYSSSSLEARWSLPKVSELTPNKIKSTKLENLIENFKNTKLISEGFFSENFGQKQSL